MPNVNSLQNTSDFSSDHKLITVLISFLLILKNKHQCVLPCLCYYYLANEKHMREKINLNRKNWFI